MSRIRFEGVSKSYRRAMALDQINLDIEPAGLTVVCGPPGCGKSVLARLLIGLEAPSAGRILFDGEDITQTPAAERSIGYVPQSFALFPHMTVFDNIAYPMALQGVPRSDIARRVDQAAESFALAHCSPSGQANFQAARSSAPRSPEACSRTPTSSSSMIPWSGSISSFARASWRI